MISYCNFSRILIRLYFYGLFRSQQIFYFETLTKLTNRSIFFNTYRLRLRSISDKSAEFNRSSAAKTITDGISKIHYTIFYHRIDLPYPISHPTPTPPLYCVPIATYPILTICKNTNLILVTHTIINDSLQKVFI